jgi:peptidoglycan/xylan/chitin deacetylase (PgdA/CDA1 family)
MSDNGISFGSHTLTHPFLTRIPYKHAQREIRLSKDIIEQKIGKPVTTFAYPSGNFDSEIKRIVKDAGYSAAVSTIPGHNSMHDDVYVLKRNVIQLQSVCHKLFPLSFLAEMTGALGHVRAFYHRMKRL